MKNKKTFKILMIIAITLIPFIYSFFYLKAFWDPYGNLKDVKIAIVNEDAGSQSGNLGQDLVNKLIEKDVMKIEVVQKDKAQEGLINQEYYATIDIPQDFTSNVKSAETENKVTTTITYSPNQKTNYLASQIISKVVTGMEKDLRSEISKEIVGTLSDSLNEVPDNLEKINDNVAKISDGAKDLNSGTKEFKSGISKLSENYSSFDSGVSKLFDGINSLNSGLELYQSNIEKLKDGTTQIASRAKGLPKVSEGASDIATNSNAINSAIAQYIDANNKSIGDINTALSMIVNNPNSDAQSKAIATQIQKQIADSNATTYGNTIKQKEDALNTGIQTFATSTASLGDLSTALDKLSSSTEEISKAITKLTDGSSSLVNGSSDLKDASGKINTGINKLKTASGDLNTGTSKLVDGTETFNNELSNSIADAKTDLKKLEGLDEFAANPVEINESDYAKVSSYGISFTPYFVSLSLWVGSLILLIVLYFDPHNRFPILGEDADNKFLRFLIYSALATFQGFILGFLLKDLLHYSVTNIWLYYGTFILVANVFFTIIHYLITQLGDLGKLISIVLLVLQLSASGGTFPVETIPEFFQKIHPYMPFTYSLGLIKESIISTDSNLTKHYIIILVSLLIVCYVITLVTELLVKFFKQRKKLREAK